MAKVIMIQGTMSNVGKSLVTAGLCRILKQDGYKVCPFKSQNMALNSYITREGLEMGRAQVMQAEAAGIEPSVKMNPVLLKPNSDTGSQIIINGEVRDNLSAWEYYKRKMEFLPEIMEAYHALEKEYDVIVIEGAGSPAEINLKENDFVNMGMAELADSRVLLVGDIDRGGVFAQLYGTVALLEEEERNRICGLVINKFRGDVSILEPGLRQLEELTGIPVLGTIPYMKLDLDEEDSLSERLHGYEGEKDVKLAVIRTPRMSNFTDFMVFEQFKQVSLYYVTSPKELHEPDLIFLPGTKSTMNDLRWLRQSGLESLIQREKEKGTVIFGICGGYQMLGRKLYDPEQMEGGGEIAGMNLLPFETVFEKQKHRSNISGKFGKVGGILSGLSDMDFKGYEIHHGRCVYEPDCGRMAFLEDGKEDGAQCGQVYGSYIHGLFDENDIAETIVKAILKKKKTAYQRTAPYDRTKYKESQYDKLADGVRKALDMEAVYRILGVERKNEEPEEV